MITHRVNFILAVCLLPGLGACRPLNTQLNSVCKAASVAGGTPSLNPISNQQTGKGPLAQSFILQNPLSLSAVAITLQAELPANETLGGTITIEIQKDQQNNVNFIPSNPSGEVVATTGAVTISAQGLSNTRALSATFNLTSTLTLDAKKIYWLVVSATYAPTDDSRLLYWQGNPDDPYPLGKSLKYDAAGFSWSDLGSANTDLVFRLGCE